MQQQLRLLACATALSLSLSGAAGATDLEDVLNAAREADPEFAAWVKAHGVQDSAL